MAGGEAKRASGQAGSAKARSGRPDALANALAGEIQSGALAPGQWLKQIDIEQRHGAKRMDVRRALDRLVQKRLVVHLPNRGYHVVKPDGRLAREIRDVRVILETGAVDGIMARLRDEDVAEALRLARRFESLLGKGTVIDLHDANIAFHGHLLGLSGNPELTALVQELRGRISSAAAGQWQKRSRIEQSNREHFAMVEALAARDAAALRRLVRAHILQDAA
ncbi:GntR family transcriptional regulator [Bosea minatitlanensis]|uniref:GntR family transcriptional regulator n=1 Tax=Bosea minatitlanensis TaxID=128782 RepID=A0ABW0F2T1_9HYPH|nr:GntR family transcriptional regulator [Bosea minatitlanensis]MCT4496069.1 GntR family transcriptional regulator [Bosea minatitlanensis]